MTNREIEETKIFDEMNSGDRCKICGLWLMDCGDCAAIEANKKLHETKDARIKVLEDQIKELLDASKQRANDQR